MSTAGKPGYVALWENFAANRFVALGLLILVSAWAYFANLHLSLLEGSEGLYAGIAGEMKRRGEFFDLTYQGLPYFNKPPFFFWLLSLSTSIWGDNEVALRVPGSLAAVGTIALVYLLGICRYHCNRHHQPSPEESILDHPCIPPDDGVDRHDEQRQEEPVELLEHRPEGHAQERE